MKKIILFGILSLMCSFTFAQLDHFNVIVTPNPLKANEAADVKVIALDENGDVYKDYVGDIYIEANPVLDESDIVYPSNQYYTFKAEDQGEKTFSKGMIFRKAGEYDITILDIFSSQSGSVKVEVTESSLAITGSVMITSPVKGTIAKTEPVSVVGSSDLQNSPFNLYLNGELYKEDITDGNGDFNVGLIGLENGSHKIKIEILDLNDSVLAESEEIDFEYDGVVSEWFKGLKLIPGNILTKGSTLRAEVTTIEDISSVEISIGSKFLMEKESNGKFFKEIVMNELGEFNVDLILTKGGDIKEYKDQEKITVVDGNSIGVVTVKQLPGSIDKAELEWEYNGDINKFKVSYGVDKENLDIEIESTINKINLEGLDPSKLYYAQVFPLDQNSQIDGTPSTIVTIELTHGSACTVQGIKLSTKIIDGKNYLVWDKVSGASKYIVYKAEKETNGKKEDLQKVGETNELQFEYPFDISSKKDVYAYYAVYALCENEEHLIDSVKLIKVGPMDTFLVLLFISIFIYGLYNLYRISKE